MSKKRTRPNEQALTFQLTRRIETSETSLSISQLLSYLGT